MVVDFHPQIGPIIEYIYPPEFKDERLLKQIPSYALPDLCHLHDKDYVYFNFQTNFKHTSKQIYGVSCFK